MSENDNQKKKFSLKYCMLEKVRENFSEIGYHGMSELTDLFPAPLVAKICCYGGQAIRLRLVKSKAFMRRWLENCCREVN